MVESREARAGAVVVAAGQGRRMGGVDKGFLPLGGRPVLFWSLSALSAVPEIREIVVVVAPGEEDAVAGRIAGGRFPKVAAVVPGGAERQFSVAAGLDALSPQIEIVAVHDGARPLVEPEAVRQALARLAAEDLAGVALGVPVKDTIKELDEGGLVAGTPRRERLWAVQTPQVFRVAVLRQAHAEARASGVLATDDCALVERLGLPVALVPGDYRNLKVTTWDDLALAERLLAKRAGGAEEPHASEWRSGRCGAMRVGVGYDVHRLVEGRDLVLGGVRVPYEKGLLGHSDADVLTHALMDALLGAAGLGDIGQQFPDTDPAYAGADSLALLGRVGALVAGAGYRVHNADAVVIAERPKLAPHLPAMRERLAAALGCAPDAVGLKATTTEGLGFTGRGEGIAAQAVCLLAKRED